MSTGLARPLVAAAALAGALVAGGCGKKGPPLPPFVRIPAPVEKITAARFGQRIYVTLTVPSTNIDDSTPVDISRVDVYGYTGRDAPPRARWAELGTIVATIPVATPPETASSEPARVAEPSSTAVTPGAALTVLDSLEPEELIQGRQGSGQEPEGSPSATPNVSPVLRRFYIAIPFSRRNRPGPPGQQADVVLTALPAPPTDLRVAYDASSVVLTWEPSGGVLGFLLERRLPPEPAPPGIDTLPSTPPVDQELPSAAASLTYQVYREDRPVVAAEVGAVPAISERVVKLPVPMNLKPLTVTTATDAVDFGRGRCYTVRAQGNGVLSEPSPSVCVTPVDTFAPQSPRGLVAVPSDGAINLIWEPGAESDLGGYMVLRQGPGDDTLRQLTSDPVMEARYRDATVEPGQHYTYAVVAVDSQTPEPNASAPSTPVDEVAR
jgi:hypothetical protein